MSYARFGWEGSDVYVYLDVRGYLNCCACRFLPDLDSVGFSKTDDMLAHLQEHRAAGHCVPEDTFKELEADRERNDSRITDLKANRKLEQSRGEL